MPLGIEQVLEVLRGCDIEMPDAINQTNLPDVGRVEASETIYSTSIEAVFAEDDNSLSADFEDEQLEGRSEVLAQPPEPHCAWYCPIHFCGRKWGIYIRERCVLSYAREIFRFADRGALSRSGVDQWQIRRECQRAAFYALYLHEQFHHKVESLGFRLLVTTGSDRYRPYKQNVYRSTYLTADCLEETLANAESYRRLNEDRYTKRLSKPVREALRRFLNASFRRQPPGYREGEFFVAENRYRNGLSELQSQVLDGRIPPRTPTRNWLIAPKVITSLMDISDKIYIILPVGARPIFRPTSIDPTVLLGV
jgi:hypothetical protein